MSSEEILVSPKQDLYNQWVKKKNTLNFNALLMYLSFIPGKSGAFLLLIKCSVGVQNNNKGLIGATRRKGK